MEKKSKVLGHLAALGCISIWGTTFVSTKILLRVFSPAEILLLRFLIAYAMLWILCPHALHLKSWKEEVPFALSGLTGVTFYFLMQNIALNYTKASNVAVIVTTAPFFIALVCYLLGERSDRPRWNFYLGFVVSLAGICLLDFSKEGFSFSPLGDGLALSAAVAWAFYSFFLTKCYQKGYGTVQITRRCFLYGILFLLPLLPFLGVSITTQQLLDPVALGNILFLGVGASAVCFLIWNYAVKVLGPVASGVYIYLDPVMTCIFAYFFLDERMSGSSILGTVLVLAGLILSQFQL